MSGIQIYVTPLLGHQPDSRLWRLHSSYILNTACTHISQLSNLTACRNGSASQDSSGPHHLIMEILSEFRQTRRPTETTQFWWSAREDSAHKFCRQNPPSPYNLDVLDPNRLYHAVANKVAVRWHPPRNCIHFNLAYSEWAIKRWGGGDVNVS